MIEPGGTIGILGGGQLGRMLAIAAARLGLHTHFFSDDPSAPAFEMAQTHTVADYEDGQAVETFARAVDAVTYEFENIPLETAKIAGRHSALMPSLKALETGQDRITEKAFLRSAAIPTAPHAVIRSKVDVEPASRAIAYPGLLKTSRFGYDGKGQVRVASAEDVAGAHEAIGSCPAVLEQIVDFKREISVIAVRDHAGSVRTYDVVENHHTGQILQTSTVPANVSDEIADQACAIAGLIMDRLDYIGVMAVELFHYEGPDGHGLLVNEIAPRVHNSGHWTLDACTVCQFENHMRAIAGWPLGSTQRHSDAVMTNLIGAGIDRWAEAAAEPMTAVHLYAKEEPRPGRKMGHITRLKPLESTKN